MKELHFVDSIPTCEALSIIYGTMESDSKTFKSFVTTGFLMESGASEDIVMESVMDTFKSIAEGIKKFIEKIKEFFRKILLYITSAYQDLDKVAVEVKKVIENKTKINFTVDGFEFTVLDKKGPDTSEFKDIVSKYNTDMEKVADLKQHEIKKEITDWLEESNQDRLRAKTLGVHDSIPDDDFLEEVRKYYRNGEDSSHSITVDRAMVDKIISHAKRLEEAKRSSMKDRDELILLLSKTETFFGRTIQTFYKGSSRQINANKVNIDDNKFSKEDNIVTVNNETSKTITMYASYKSKQVNKIASMINLVACERVNALKDQIKQEREILRKCLFGNTEEKPSSTTESVNINEDYQILAMKSKLKDYAVYEEMSRNIILTEAIGLAKAYREERVSALLETVSVMEADRTKLGGKVKQAIYDIIDYITGLFRQKTIENCDKYSPWVDDLLLPENKIVEKAEAKKEFTMANFVDLAKAKTMASDIVKAVNAAYKNDNYQDVSWATGIMKGLDSRDKLNNTDLRKNLINYFRTGQDAEEIPSITYKGDALKSQITKFTTYIKDYKTLVSPVDSIKKQIKTSSNSFKLTEENKTNPLTDSTYFELLGRQVCETDLALFGDYSILFENTKNKVKIGPGGSLAGDTETGQSVRNAATAAKNESKANQELSSATDTQSTEDPEKAKEVKQATDTVKSKSEATSYKSMIDGFFKSCISLYLKAREEQFIAYVNALSDIDGERPKFDKNGNYIKKADRTKEEGTKEEGTAEKVESK